MIVDDDDQHGDSQARSDDRRLRVMHDRDSSAPVLTTLPSNRSGQRSKGRTTPQNAAAAIAVCRRLAVRTQRSSKASAPTPASRTAWSASARRTAFSSSTTARRPTRPRPLRRSPPFPSIRWILGGQAKTDNLDECAPHFAHVRSAYTIGEAGELFARLLAPHMPVTNCETLENALNHAAEDSQAGDTVLLSPACASFDQFKDFEQRGDRFRDLVGAL